MGYRKHTMDFVGESTSSLRFNSKFSMPRCWQMLTIPQRTLDIDTSFPHLLSLLRVSGPQQLDFPNIHVAARRIFEASFPSNPEAFTHNHPLYEALPVAQLLNIPHVSFLAHQISLKPTISLSRSRKQFSTVWSRLPILMYLPHHCIRIHNKVNIFVPHPFVFIW